MAHIVKLCTWSEDLLELNDFFFSKNTKKNISWNRTDVGDLHVCLNMQMRQT